MSGLANHITGHAAEEVAARAYAGKGAVVLERCWRCEAGEIDLILKDGDTYIFAEVKSRKTIDDAAAAISSRQWARIAAAAEIYLYETVGQDMHDMRFDAVLLDRNGTIKIVENAAEF